MPVTIASGLTEEEIRELRIADNKTNESEWDTLALSEDLNGLSFEGFCFEDLTDLMSGIEVALPQEDEPDTSGAGEESGEVYNPRGIQLGEIWQLGNHRLMCGSSTDPADVKKLMGNTRAKLLFTSPPYGDLREYNGGKNLEVRSIAQFIQAYSAYADIQAVNLGILTKDSEILTYWDEYILAARACGLKLFSWNVWDKMMCGSIGQHEMMIPVRHEFIFVFGEKAREIRYTMPKKEASIYTSGREKTRRQKDGSTKRSSAGNTQKAFKKMESVLEIPEPKHLTSVTKKFPETSEIRRWHPATFPVLLPSEYIVAFTEPGDAVAEPFCGSGTTLVACEQSDRVCYGMELDETYMNVIIDRWEKLTGKQAGKAK